MRGRQGHGYDPMFEPDGHELTFAEMAPAEKNRISHRARAFARLVEACFG
jgi:XTP/dITP diphosphohydrolase